MYGLVIRRDTWCNVARVCMQLEIGTRPTSTDAHSSTGIGHRPSRASATHSSKPHHWRPSASYTPRILAQPKPLDLQVLQVQQVADLRLLRCPPLALQINLGQLHRMERLRPDRVHSQDHSARNVASPWSWRPLGPSRLRNRRQKRGLVRKQQRRFKWDFPWVLRLSRPKPQ